LRDHAGAKPAGVRGRDKFARELKKLEIKERLFRLTKVEVYHQGPKATRAFLESVLNRADARGQTLGEATNDRHYCPAVSLRGWDPSEYLSGKVGMCCVSVAKPYS
jgi:hypothetical protein